MFDVPRTRFAPSPTGYLHIGGARTALFNYLLAKRLNGRFLLRIEDTDQTRNIAGAEKKLLDDLRWLGLHWDEGPEIEGPATPYRQSQRVERYHAVARQLLDSGQAYYAFETREELDAMRQAAQKAKKAFRYPRPANFPSDADAEKARAEGRPVVVRFRMPGHDFTVNDLILGSVTVAANELDDFVILKADGWPTYHFAVVVDDEHMQITHVLRGQEHLMNTPNHLGLQEALGYRTPAYAHLPIILNMDGSKMSKREKDNTVRAALEAAIASNRIDEAKAAELSGCDMTGFRAWRGKETQLENEGLDRLARELTVQTPEIQIHDFRASGYLPEALLNFIALLGWSPGADREKMTMSEMCELFSAERIGKTNARFDRAKLLNFNMSAIAASSDERRLAAFRDYLDVNRESPLSGADDATLARLMKMNEGFRTFREVDEKSAAIFIADDRLRYDDASVKKVLLKSDGEGLKALRGVREKLVATSEWNAAALESAVRAFCEQATLGLGKVAQPIRVAITGSMVSPPLFDTLELLGKTRALARVDQTLARAARGEFA